ncbi:hypothetical protein TIFTF001_010374 [Ficus carica]|uniref:Uncharacterized protein n=1 Tax=Ficus carica TaxID=3494 RepID=A0AA88CZT4_FICCA|nr:hypothetical protein TIFTF001_010374 [Ficus carica]
MGAKEFLDSILRSSSPAAAVMPSPEGIGLGGGGVGVGGALLLKQGLPASRAGGVGDQPRVNAPDVEPVVTFGQNPDSLAFLELTEADGAVRVEDLDRGCRSVGRDGDLPQCALLQPRGGQPRRGLVRRLERKPPRAPQRAPHDRIRRRDKVRFYENWLESSSFQGFSAPNRTTKEMERREFILSG